MSEKDPRAIKRKDSSDKSRMDDEMINDAGANQNIKPKIPNPSTLGPSGTNDSKKPHTNSPEKKRESDKDA